VRRIELVPCLPGTAGAQVETHRTDQPPTPLTPQKGGVRRRGRLLQAAGRTPRIVRRRRRRHHGLLLLLLDPGVDLDDPAVPGLLPDGLLGRLLAGPEALLGSVLVAGVLPEVEHPQPLRLLYEGDPLLLTQLLPPLSQVLDKGRQLKH
jgi:hypothetical protein